MTLNKAALFHDVGYAPHPGQLDIHNSTAPRRVVACGVRWGKSRCAAMEALSAAMEPKERSVGWVCAPTYDLCDRVFREIVVVVAEHLRHRIVSLKENDKRLVIRNMAGGLSEIRGKSADNPISLLGEGLDWLIVDEAARLRPMIWESHLSQRLIDKRGWALFITTPRGKGWLYVLFRRGQGDDPDYRSWNCPSWSNPFLDAQLIEQERDRLPERVFAQEYGAEFIEGSGSVFRNVRECATGEAVTKPDREAVYYIGLDLAKVEDYTVVAVMTRKRQLVFGSHFNKVDWNIQLGRIKTIAHAFNDARMLVDSTGAGEPIYEALCHAGCIAKPYPFTQRSKSALIDNLALMFEQRLITLLKPDIWPEIIEELEAFEYSVTDNGNVRTGAPSGMHDDTVIALALAAWQVQPNQRGPGLTVGWLTPRGQLMIRSTDDYDDDDD